MLGNCEMTGDSIDSRVGKLEGLAFGVQSSIDRLHADNEKFERKQDEILAQIQDQTKKLDKIITERNLIVAWASALSGLAATIATWVFSHWKGA